MHTFTSQSPPAAPNAFIATTGNLTVPNFKDHDDVNLFYDNETQTWVDFQIMYQTYEKRYCDNVHGARRVVTVRTSDDGVEWSDDFGCMDHPQTSEHCSAFNLSNMIVPGDFRAPDDPPELEFYRIRPFTIGSSKRLAAHVLIYVPSPSDVVVMPGYGRQPLWYCKGGCCHGPHMYEEWWLGPSDGNPTNMMGWKRPYFDTRAFPHDIWAMANPVMYNRSQLWVDNGAVWGLPENRLAGLYTSSNAEFTTLPFAMPKSQLWLNADAYWQGGNGVGGADEGRAAYLLAELIDADSQTVIPGHERDGYALLNKGGIRMPMVWKNATKMQAPAPGTRVQVRFYFRDATIYAVGSDD